jgi:hypothetical protein
MLMINQRLGAFKKRARGWIDSADMEFTALGNSALGDFFVKLVHPAWPRNAGNDPVQALGSLLAPAPDDLRTRRLTAVCVD